MVRARGPVDSRLQLLVQRWACTRLRAAGASATSTPRAKAGVKDHSHPGLPPLACTCAQYSSNANGVDSS